MNRTTSDEITRLGGDPTDEVWLWLANRGLHGNSFTWGQTRKEPSGYVGVSHLQEVVEDLTTSIPAFRERTLHIVNLAMESRLPELIRRAVQVAAVMGGDAELKRVKQLASSPDAAIASDAKASVFYLKNCGLAP